MFRLLTLSLVLATVFVAPAPLYGAFTVQVVDSEGNRVKGFRWLVEVDNTHHVEPGVRSFDVMSLGIHRSHSPVLASGHTRSNRARVNVARDGRYFVSVLPDDGYTMSGCAVGPRQRKATVIVNKLPIPTAQISVYVFHDHRPLNNAPDFPTEEGLENFSIIIKDAAGHELTDAFGNNIGTTYLENPDESFILDGEGMPIVDVQGTGIVLTDENGEALIKNLPPGKFGVIAIPPAGEGSFENRREPMLNHRGDRVVFLANVHDVIVDDSPKLSAAGSRRRSDENAGTDGGQGGEVPAGVDPDRGDGVGHRHRRTPELRRGKVFPREYLQIVPAQTVDIHDGRATPDDRCGLGDRG